MRVALLNAPYAETYGPIKSASGRYFPLGLGYIAAVLLRGGHEVLFLDPEAQGLSGEAMAGRLASFRPRLAGISFATPTFPPGRRLASLVKRAAPGCFTVAGGVHASALPEAVLGEAPEFDAVARGEGEHTMLELASLLEDGPASPSALAGVRGIAIRAGDGVAHSPPRPWIRDLDSLPFPARSLANFDAYVPHAHNRRGRRATTAISSRGCPHRCVFCASHVVLGRLFRAHSPEYVVEELTDLTRTFGVDEVIFNDDTFTADRNRALKICDLIRARGLRISWFCFARVDTVSRELLRAMRDAGCYSVGFGVESGDPGILRSIRKNTTVDQARQAVAWCDELGLKSQCFFVFGCPGETPETAERTIRLALELSPALAFFNMMVPYPGTEAFARDAAPPSAPRRWEEWVAIGPHSTISVPGIPSLERLVSSANIRFYLRLRQIFKMIGFAGNFGELWQLLRGALALSRQVLRWRA